MVPYKKITFFNFLGGILVTQFHFLFYHRELPLKQESGLIRN